MNWHFEEYMRFPFLYDCDTPDFLSFINKFLCVDSCISYDGLTKAVESIHNMFLVCFCARHRLFPPSSEYGGAN